VEVSIGSISGGGIACGIDALLTPSWTDRGYCVSFLPVLLGGVLVLERRLAFYEYNILVTFSFLSRQEAVGAVN
jgi:hypothetical protein